MAASVYCANKLVNVPHKKKTRKIKSVPFLSNPKFLFQVKIAIKRRLTTIAGCTGRNLKIGTSINR
jgi:hypothetical protein